MVSKVPDPALSSVILFEWYFEYSGDDQQRRLLKGRHNNKSTRSNI